VLVEPCNINNVKIIVSDSNCKQKKKKVNWNTNKGQVESCLQNFFQEVAIHLRLPCCNFRNFLMQVLHCTPKWRGSSGKLEK
jgi:hypothetical protein